MLISHAGKPGRPLEEIANSGRASVASLDEVRLALLWPHGPTGTFSSETAHSRGEDVGLRSILLGRLLPAGQFPAIIRTWVRQHS